MKLRCLKMPELCLTLSLVKDSQTKQQVWKDEGKKKDSLSDSWVTKEADWGRSSKNEGGRRRRSRCFTALPPSRVIVWGATGAYPSWLGYPGQITRSLQGWHTDTNNCSHSHADPFFTLHHVGKLVQAFVSSVGSLTRAFKKLQHTWRSSAHPKSPEDTSAHQTHGLQPPRTSSVQWEIVLICLLPHRFGTPSRPSEGPTNQTVWEEHSFSTTYQYAVVLKSLTKTSVFCPCCLIHLPLRSVWVASPSFPWTHVVGSGLEVVVPGANLCGEQENTETWPAGDSSQRCF